MTKVVDVASGGSSKLAFEQLAPEGLDQSVTPLVVSPQFGPSEQ